MIAEGLSLRKKNASVADRVTLHVVEESVRAHFQVVVQTVGTQHTDKRLVLYLRLWYITKVHTGRIALIFHVQPELFFLHVGGQVVNVLHHQVPVSLCGVVAGVLQ